MRYHSITISAPLESRDAIMRMLSDRGSTGFLDHDDSFTAYFDATVPPAELSAELNTFKTVLRESGLAPDFSFSTDVIPETDWNEEWKKNFVPIDVGERFTIIPSWLENRTDRIPLIIDPGMVFGTGHHETTRTCLALMEKYAPQVSKTNFLDVGTGTGILAIAAARLGFPNVVGVDIDPMAVDAAARNMEANSFSRESIREGSIPDVEGEFDLIAANLLEEILVASAPDIAAHLKQDGIAVLSGMLEGQEVCVIEAMTVAGLKTVETVKDGRWVSVVMSHSGRA